MASTEIEMNKFSEGSTGTDGRVDELTFPVDISHGSRSQQTHANEEDLDLESNLQNENFGGGPSGGSSEDDEGVHPVSESRSEAEVEGQRRVTFLEPISCTFHSTERHYQASVQIDPSQKEEDEDVGGRTHQPVGDLENTDHTVTVEESDRICRTCGPDEEITEPDNLLVKLGCNCRGSLRRMHRKCILEWYGPRICQQNNYKCELCNAVLHGRIEHIVFRALVGQDSGKDILLKAMGILAPRRSRSRARPRRNAIVEAPTPQAQDGNAHPDFHQVSIVEITNPAQQPLHPIWNLARSGQENRPYHGATGGYPMCVVVFIILVLIGFGVAGVGRLH